MNFLIKNGIVYFRNKIRSRGCQIDFPNIHCAGNDIYINGIGNAFSIAGKGYIRNSACQINGENNQISVDDNSIIVNNCNIRIKGNNNRLEIAKNCSINTCSIFIAGNDNVIKIGDSVSSVYTSYQLERDNNSISIGNGTSLHGRSNGIIEFVLEEATSITIKQDCMISNDTVFRSSDSHSIIDENGDRINPARDIIINDHVWIGMRSLILKGTVVENNCIIGSGSVCNKVYDKEGCLIAGVPAGIIREKVNWSRDRL